MKLLFHITRRLLLYKLYETKHIEFDWKEFHTLYLSSCSCTAIKTDLETYVELDGHEEACIEEMEKFLISHDLKLKEIVKRHRTRVSFDYELF